MKLTAMLVLLTFPAAVAWSQSLNETLKFFPADGAPSARFGGAVAIDGNLVVLGAATDTTGVPWSGSAYVYDASGSFVVKLLALDAQSQDSFGASVAISGVTIIVGAPRDDDHGATSGSAYVFNATTGTQTLKLTPLDGAPGKSFGSSVAISGSTALIGSYEWGAVSATTGSAYLFDASTGVQLVKLQPLDGTADDGFGGAVALNGNLALVGARWDDDNGNGSGSVYVFEATSGVQLMKLVAPDGQEHDRFGYSVALEANMAVIGSREDDDNGPNSGSAYLFDLVSGLQTAKLLASDGSPGDVFGSSVAISGTRVVVGAFEHDSSSFSTGAAYVFDALTGQQVSRLLASDPGKFDRFGRSVAVAGDTAIIGVGDDSVLGFFSGSAYIFDAATPPLNSGNAYCFGDGTEAVCPCAAYGNSGEGCANTTGTGGAKLAASGSAYLFNGTFRMGVTGVPGAKPGLILRGNNALALPAGDGLLCTSGASQRSQIQVTSGGNTTFGDFQGSSFGQVANLGSPTRWQFWYRDASNPCSGAGFNFSNGWETNFLP